MSVLRKRDRQIAFRVSEDEYRALQIACLESGSRSISDLAREAVRGVAGVGSQAPFARRTDPGPTSLTGRVGRIEEVLERLMEDLHEIKKRLAPSANSA